jgi:hypothetical protein
MALHPCWSYGAVACVACLAAAVLPRGSAEEEEAIPPKVQRYLELAIAEREERLDWLPGSIREMEKNLRNYAREHSDDEVRAFRKLLAARKQELRLLADRLPVPQLRPAELEIEQIGRFDLTGEGSAAEFLVDEVRGPDELYGRLLNQARDPLVIRGLATEGLVDGARIELREVFEITATEQAGRRTVFVAERFDTDQVEPYLDKVKLKPPGRDKRSPARSKPRE